jgi:DNA-binding HxlR family transcriptional regulator
MTKIKESSTNFENKQVLSACCVEVYAINLIGGQWTLTICCALANGKLRFGELKKSIPNITERMLTLQLRKMEANKLVRRIVYAEVPPRVEYELTKSAQELTPILDQLQAWGERHKKTGE